MDLPELLLLLRALDLLLARAYVRVLLGTDLSELSLVVALDLHARLLQRVVTRREVVLVRATGELAGRHSGERSLGLLV